MKQVFLPFQIQLTKIHLNKTFNWNSEAGNDGLYGNLCSNTHFKGLEYRVWRHLMARAVPSSILLVGMVH